MFSIFLTLTCEDFRPGLLLLGIWLILCWLNATRSLLARSGLEASSHAALSSRSSSIESMTIRELPAKILRLYKAGSGL
jgi:hypothetical protein